MFRLLANSLVAISALAVIAAATPARASDTGPVIVIPSRPGVPIIINGRDVSYAVVGGDWGLARPGAVPVTIIGPAPYVHFRRETRRNYPRYGIPPERGRYEIEPPPDRMLPEPAESFHRSWSTQSDVSTSRQIKSFSRPQYPQRPVDTDANMSDDVVPPTIDDPEPFNPPIIVAPRMQGAHH